MTQIKGFNEISEVEMMDIVGAGNPVSDFLIGWFVSEVVNRTSTAISNAVISSAQQAAVSIQQQDWSSTSTHVSG